ncbi:MAG: hypothetical protein D6834_00525 [Aquificota bacterium]|nr:MAG: hypothetical protein D6834_00525 [Aquificota bacterium]
MKYYKTGVLIPEEALKEIRKKGNVSAVVEGIGRMYIDKHLEENTEVFKKVSTVVSVSEQFIKEIHSKRKERVREFLSKAITQWWKEYKDA